MYRKKLEQNATGHYTEIINYGLLNSEIMKKTKLVKE